MTPPADLPSAGFCLVVHGGRATIETFGGASPLLQVAESDGATLLLLGRLHYRADLASRLRRPTDRYASDAQLALAAFAELGADACALLEGEFAIVVLDRRRRRLVALRDPCGGYPLYWTRAGAGIGVASLLRPLVRFTGSADIERELLGDILGIGYSEIDCFEKSAIRGIERLVPGTSLTADLWGGPVEIRRFWDWRQRIRDPGTDDLHEIGARYGALLRDAVA
jgi:asparagine synthase (glutamine-hydrolysing)